ncbi:TOM13-domain-containing protein [Macroventuria anomochaeta]|uniref:TOM13-domain-containing protein n=1 Tax=Macroventuria anomochaeta TaxID=301207 RepID=A0ACB6RXG8_9PLEO|nr:TOM13-domain-containing protein [Macroventuria anomochaeta]KAF2626606.1 TOM13-domain-containing protein [Macroventuria anomochaeta]
MSDPLDILPTDPAAAGGMDASTTTFPSDSENYESADVSPSPPSSSSPLILYSPPTLWGLIRGAAINLLLPFVNGLMLGFGELVANEAAFRLGWSGTKIFPAGRSDSRRVGPGVEMRADPVERRRRNGQELDMYTALE